MLEIEGITVRFGGVMPLNGATLTLPSGICGLIGPNGAGKTTLLNVISGFVRPDEGRVRMGGDDLLAMAPHTRARWGLRRTFQKEQVLAGLTVRQNVELAADHMPARGDAAADVDDGLELVGLGHRADVLAAEVSTMERRLVEIARSVMCAPKLVLLDEPGAGLADDETQRLVAVLQALQRHTGALLVLVDHDMDLVRATCDRAAVLDFGRVIANGPPGDVLADPDVRRVYFGEDL